MPKIKLKHICTALSFFLLTAHLYANCGLAQMLKDPGLANNSKFWTDYAALQSKYSNHIPDHEVDKLTKAYLTPAASKLPLSTFRTPSNPPARQIESNNSVNHEVKNLSPALKKKYDAFLELVTTKEGLSELRNNPGSWRLEKLKDGTDAYTIRLNDAYRVMFRFDENTVEIQMVNKGRVHKN
jgi:plasmid maintenance system killer protein